MTRPTIEELEHILAGGNGPQRIEMLPNGEIRAVSYWQSVETAPKGRKIIAGYFNGLGNWRSVMACYYLPKTLDWNSDFDGGDEDGFAPEAGTRRLKTVKRFSRWGANSLDAATKTSDRIGL